MSIARFKKERKNWRWEGQERGTLGFFSTFFSPFEGHRTMNSTPVSATNSTAGTGNDDEVFAWTVVTAVVTRYSSAASRR